MIRQYLNERFSGLREKLNSNSKYLGYALDGKSDALYIYVQKKQLVLDIRVSSEEAEGLRKKRYKVNPRDNFQNKAGWLTGICIDHEAKDIMPIIELAILALEG